MNEVSCYLSQAHYLELMAADPIAAKQARKERASTWVQLLLHSDVVMQKKPLLFVELYSSYEQTVYNLLVSTLASEPIREVLANKASTAGIDYGS